MERKNMWEGYSEAELKELEAVNAVTENVWTLPRQRENV